MFSGLANLGGQGAELMVFAGGAGLCDGSFNQKVCFPGCFRHWFQVPGFEVALDRYETRFSGGASEVTIDTV